MAQDLRSDRALISAINAGPPGAEEAFEALYLRHRAWCARVARRMTPDEAEAMDLVQEAFLTLLEQFPGYEPRGEVTSFLYAVMRHRALTAGRRRGRERRARVGLQLRLARTDEPRTPDEPPDTQRVRAAIDRLPPPQREALLMRIVDGMSVAEVAAALDVPEGTVKSRLHHALAALRKDPDAQAAHGD